MPKAARSPDLLATRFIKLIGKLFAAEARTAKWKANQRQRLRRRYSARVLDAIHDLMLEQSPGVVPNSLLGKALTYAQAVPLRRERPLAHIEQPLRIRSTRL